MLEVWREERVHVLLLLLLLEVVVLPTAALQGAVAIGPALVHEAIAVAARRLARALLAPPSQHAAAVAVAARTEVVVAAVARLCRTGQGRGASE